MCLIEGEGWRGRRVEKHGPSAVHGNTRGLDRGRERRGAEACSLRALLHRQIKAALNALSGVWQTLFENDGVESVGRFDHAIHSHLHICVT